MRSSGIFAAGMYAGNAKAIAGPFQPGELLHNIPADKKLDPSWVRSLSKRGYVTKYIKTRNELKYIGMPVGGINAGTVYLGGDGRLWLWDIFNANQNGIEPKTIEWHSSVHVGKKIRSQDGSAYVQPAKDIRPLEQGFAFKIVIGGKTIIKKMEASDWDDIIFEATYPMAKVRYIDKQLPIDITAEIFSPFIPLDEKNSSLPCTVYSFNIKNRSAATITVDVLGWLENKVAPRSERTRQAGQHCFFRQEHAGCFLFNRLECKPSAISCSGLWQFVHCFNWQTGNHPNQFFIAHHSFFFWSTNR